MEAKIAAMLKNRKMIAALVLISFIIPLMSSINQSNEASSTSIYVNPAAVIIPSGTDFTVKIDVEDVTALYGWQVSLEFDPYLLQLFSVSEGDFLKTGGPTLFELGMNQPAGRILVFSYLDAAPGGPSVSGSGTLMEIAFHGVGVGNCILDLVHTQAIDSQTDTVSDPIGDTNGDSKVNAIDLGNVARAFGTSAGDPRYDANADFNKDNVVDIYDVLCAGFNFARTYPGNALQPRIISHDVQDGSVVLYGSVTWKWLNYYKDEVWFDAEVTASGSYPLENFEFNRDLGGISFDIASDTSGFCNVTIPKLLMDGALKVFINDVETASILTWNKTHTFIYFTYGQGLQNVAVVGEIVTRIRAPDLITMVDINGDGIVNILDITAVAVRNQWEEDP